MSEIPSTLEDSALTGWCLGCRFELMGAINPDFVSQTQVRVQRASERERERERDRETEREGGGEG